jgi:hypothetical protein
MRRKSACARCSGVRPLGTERAHFSVETLYVDCAGLMIVNDDLSPDDDSVDVRAHSAFYKGVDDVKFRVDPGTTSPLGHGLLSSPG